MPLCSAIRPKGKHSKECVGSVKGDNRGDMRGKGGLLVLLPTGGWCDSRTGFDRDKSPMVCLKFNTIDVNS